ncbi:UBP1-associated protein 2A-like [Malania oleifera]|uniref:UBP1-associated protein 2A-like n=1 Tax=Malania oleifera TaxID=397392 RepID=UPI0025AEA128|nr:UBP1-associated protein 2A-like [Malania oleifera]
MAKKRKLRSSEPEPSKGPESETQQQQLLPQEEAQEQVEQEQQQQLQEPDQIDFIPIQEDEPEKQEQDQSMVEDEPQGEQGVQEQADQEQNDDEEEEEEEEDDEGEQILNASNETVNAPNNAVSSDPAPPEANGEQNAAEEEDGGEEDLEDEPFDRLVEPFTKEQLVLLIREAVEKYPDFVENVRKLADADPAHRKIFVHGLGWDTTNETLTSVFAKYGPIEDCKAVCDKVSGKSKGYAFILFKHRSGARKALKQPQKKIGSRMTSCQLASAGPVPAPPPVAPPVSEYTQRKIFVSNVSADIDPRKLLEFFAKYGEIEEGPLGLDKQTGKPKGFALFVYRSVESSKKALEEPHKTFEGHTLHCQKAIDGPKQSKPFHHHHHNQYYQPHHPPRKEKGKYSSSGASGPGHLMAPSAPGQGFNPGVAAAAAAAQGLNPALGQALTALLATQGAGLGITNLLGGLGGAVNQNAPPVAGHGMQGGYGNQAGASYGTQPGMQGGYQNPQMGQANVGRPPQGGPPYMGH